MDNLTAPILSKLFEATDEVIKNALTEHLGRPFSLDDAKDCVIYYRTGVLDQCTLTHKGVVLGDIKRTFENDKITVTFTKRN